jgi:hypothetical protein
MRHALLAARLLGWGIRLRSLLQLFLQLAVGQYLGQHGLYGLPDGLFDRFLHGSRQRRVEAIENAVEAIELAGQRLARLAVVWRSRRWCGGHSCSLPIKG